MDAERFVRELPALFDDFPMSPHPRDRRFAPIVEQVENLTSENVLALLSLSAACLGPTECYVEVGVYHGASLIAVLLGNDGADVVAIDGFGFRDASLDKVERNLASFGLGIPEILVGDVFELVPGGALEGRSVGVWYYDAAHDYESQLEGLRIAEPYLAPGALMIVDDTDWTDVERALEDYLAEQPLASRLLTIDGKERGFAQWWEGMQILRWAG
ncbi:MAG: class I SAM-dependent methyltransferase [Gaiellaceae bacterium]